jgi:hypothetical protein
MPNAPKKAHINIENKLTNALSKEKIDCRTPNITPIVEVTGIVDPAEAILLQIYKLFSTILKL